VKGKRDYKEERKITEVEKRKGVNKKKRERKRGLNALQCL
jgi:hypothetical protein